MLMVFGFSHTVLISSKTLFSFIEMSDSHTVAPKPTVSSPLKELIKMPILGPSPRLQNQGSPGWGPASVLTGLCFINKAADSHAH